MANLASNEEDESLFITQEELSNGFMFNNNSLIFSWSVDKRRI